MQITIGWEHPLSEYYTHRGFDAAIKHVPKEECPIDTPILRKAWEFGYELYLYNGQFNIYRKGE